MRLDLLTVQREAEKVIVTACTIIADAKRTGGCLRVIDARDGDLNYFGKIGSIADPEKHEKYLVLATEKAERLRSHPDHLTSFRSRDDERAQYQGAIRAGNFIFSFSGLPAVWDEACMMMLASLLGRLTLEDWYAIIEESGNDVVKTLWSKAHEKLES